MLTIVVLSLAFGINEMISTPTNMTSMGLIFVAGFIMLGVLVRDICIAWSYWLVAAPIVFLGAPLGAYVASRLKRDYLIIFSLSLIGLELVTTIWLLPFNVTLLMVTQLAVLICEVALGY